MTHRQPVPGPIPRDIACRVDRSTPADLVTEVATCRGRRAQILRQAIQDDNDGAMQPRRGDFWDCPAGAEHCPTGAFLYPRKVRKKNGVWSWHYHEGIDIGGVNGVTPIVAVMGGTVGDVLRTPDEVDGYTGFGRIVYVEGDDHLHYLYAHCSRIPANITKGSRVEAGQVIALVGRTMFNKPAEYQRDVQDADTAGLPGVAESQAHWMGPHLHFEVSRHRYPMGEAQTTDPDGHGMQEFRQDPAVVLGGQGSWALTPLLFPEGTIVSPISAADLHRRVEASADGYFPIGLRGMWHGGVHLPMGSRSVVATPLTGTIVALRLDPTRRQGLFGSSNFVLIRHDLDRAVARKLFASGGRRPAAPSGSGSIDPAAASGDDTLVRPVKLMLGRIVRSSSNRPYYSISDDARERAPIHSPRARPRADLLPRRLHRREARARLTLIIDLPKLCHREPP